MRAISDQKEEEKAMNKKVKGYNGCLVQNQQQHSK